jgi:hypothetical protein
MVRKTLFCGQYANAGGIIVYLLTNRAVCSGRGHYVAEYRGSSDGIVISRPLTTATLSAKSAKGI